MAAELMADDDDYIDIEIASFSNSLPSHPNPTQEFEFQISIFQESQPSSSSPADQLFYKGKLLPLHLLQNSNSLYHHHNAFQKFYDESEFQSQSDPKLTQREESFSTPSTITPFESCNVSLSESCRVCGEINPDDYDFGFDFSTKVSGFVDSVEKDQKKTRKRLKRYSSVVGSKLRAWFGKASCKYEASCAAKVADEGSVSKARVSFNNKQHQHVKVAKKVPFGQIQRDRFQSFNYVQKERTSEFKSIDTDSDTDLRHDMKYRCFTRSENEGVQRMYACQELQLLGCSDTNSEIRSSILGAIAHCKQSQQHFG